MFTLEAMVDKFGEAIAPYAVQMAQQLAGAFYKCVAGGGGGEGKGMLAIVFTWRFRGRAGRGTPCSTRQ